MTEFAAFGNVDDEYTTTVTKKTATLIPVADNVIVRRTSKEDVTPGGVILPDLAQETKFEGEVVAVGPGKLNDRGERDPVGVAPGDRVLFLQYAGADVIANDEKLIVFTSDQILAVVAE